LYVGLLILLVTVQLNTPV